MDTQIVNINDIEDLILTKHEIELKLIEDGVIEEKMQIVDFINKYALTNYVYMFNDILIPFRIYKSDKIYVFIVNDNEEEINLLMNKLKAIKFDMNNTIELSKNDMLDDSIANSVIIYKNKYYK